METTLPNIDPSKEKKVYNGTALRLIKLLGSGCTAAEASRACGVDESYTSQLKDEPEFIRQVNELVVKTMADQSQIDENYNDIEKNMSKRLLELSQFVFDPDKALRLAKFANEAKRKVAVIPGSGNNGAGNGDGTTYVAPVTLILPTQIINEFIVNPMGEIVGVNGKELVTLPSKHIDALVNKHLENAKKQPATIPLMKKTLKNGPGHTDPYSDL